MLSLKADYEAVVIETAYCPPIDFFRLAAACGRLIIEDSESYDKQSYRNRCKIYSCSGLLSLSLPVTCAADRRVTGALIDYSKPWLQQHERALEAAYKSSAFFDYYRDDLFDLLESRYERLFDLNLAIIRLLIEDFGLKCELSLTGDWLATYPETVLDARGLLHPKRPLGAAASAGLDAGLGTGLDADLRTGGIPAGLDLLPDREYYQVFSVKYGFIPGLSALDLLFNEGPNALTYLA